MKQVLIKKQPGLGNHPFTEIDLFAAPDASPLREGVNLLTLSWPFGLTSGVGYNLVLSQHLALQGVVMSAWTQRGETVEVVLLSAYGAEVPVDGKPVVRVLPFEPVQMLARDNVMSGVLTVVPKASPRRPRKKASSSRKK